MFDGKNYEFPKGEVTVLEDQHFTAPDVYRRNMSNGSPADKKAVHEYDVDAISFAHQLFRRQYTDFLLAGIYVGTTPPTKMDKEACEAKAEIWWRGAIEDFQNERNERKSGGKGRLAPDPDLVEKMKQFGIKDEVYNSTKSGMSDEDLQRLTTASAMAAVKAMQMEKETAGSRK